MASTVAASQAVPLPSLARAGIVGAIGAAVANSVLYGVARAAGVSFVAAYPPRGVPSTLPRFMPAVASLVPAVIATGAMLALIRLFRPRRAARAFLALATIAGLVSLGGPLTLAAADAGTVWTLAAMHLIAAAAITAPLLRVAVRGRSTP